MARPKLRPQPEELVAGLQLEGRGSGNLVTLGQARTQGCPRGYARLWPVLDSLGNEIKAVGAATLAKHYTLPICCPVPTLEASLKP